jgi:uncharacterized protein YecE (DUF72 family)
VPYLSSLSVHGASHLCCQQQFICVLKAKKMGCVIFQFPLSYQPTDENRRHIEWCRSQIHRSLEMAVEFRARSWFTPDASSTVVCFIHRVSWDRRPSRPHPQKVTILLFALKRKMPLVWQKCCCLTAAGLFCEHQCDCLFRKPRSQRAW